MHVQAVYIHVYCTGESGQPCDRKRDLLRHKFNVNPPLVRCALCLPFIHDHDKSRCSKQADQRQWEEMHSVGRNHHLIGVVLLIRLAKCGLVECSSG